MIIGGGIAGLSTAYAAIANFPTMRVHVIENAYQNPAPLEIFSDQNTWVALIREKLKASKPLRTLPLPRPIFLHRADAPAAQPAMRRQKRPTGPHERLVSTLHARK